MTDALWLRRSGLLLALLIGAASCIQDDGKRWHPLRRFELADADDERALGMEFDRGLREQVRVITDPVVTGFISDLGQRIVDQIGDPDYIYRFRIVEDRQLNAFAVPGGYVYFHSGTFLSSTSIDELAGVMGHEVAHVKARHYAHRRQNQQIRQALTTLPLIAVSVLAEEPGLAVTGMAMNVAMDLRFSREDEAEADRLGGVFSARAGFDPAASAVFFERIIAQQPLYANSLPPYLFTHPAAEERVEVIRGSARTLAPIDSRDSSLDSRFFDVQARLAAIVASNRLELPGEASLGDHSANDRGLERAAELRASGDPDAALTLLSEISISDPTDPRVSYRIGELMMDEGRISGAIAAFRRTTELDSSRAMVYFRLGEAYKANGDRQRAVYAFEQAVERSSPSSNLRIQADWQIVMLSYGVISEDGFADGRKSRSADTPAGESVESFPLDAARLAWWGRVSPPLIEKVDTLRVRWRSPSGHLVFQETGQKVGRVFLRSELEFGPDRAPEAGLWTVEITLEDEVVHRSQTRVGGARRL